MKKLKPIKLKTRGSYIRAHRKLWRWRADNPQLFGFKWPGWIVNGGRYPEQPSDCFVCQFACSECPLDWPPNSVNKKSCIHGGLLSQFNKACDAGQFEKASEIALQIANLKTRRKPNGI